MRYEDLSPAQLAALDKWESENDPHGIEFDCMDNTRYATKGNVDQETIYEDIRRGGCCGFYDTELNCEDGTVLLFGFNYGH